MDLRKVMAGIICTSMLLSNIIYVNAEELSGAYTGIDNAQEILNNINFRDISSMSNDYWAKDAIYKMAGLSVIKGYGDKNFVPANNVTKAEAIALIYRALGKESDAQKEGQALEEARTSDIKKKNAKAIWSDGYLSLAQKDGLITQDQFNQAVSGEVFLPSWGEVFDADSPAQRQEVAVWLAKALKIDPIYNQTTLFNNYADWQQIDQDKIPYVEALLQGKVMNGDGERFHPKSALKREEMAQLLSNAEDLIYKVNNLTKKYGYVENIAVQLDNQPGKEKTIKTVFVRGDDGKLFSITLSKEESITSQNNEIGTHRELIAEEEVIVNKNGALGKSELLNANDEILLIYDKENNVKYIQDKNTGEPEDVYYGQIIGIDAANSKVTFVDSLNTNRTFLASQGVTIAVNGTAQALEDIPYGIEAYFTVRHNIVTRIEISDTKKSNEDILTDELSATGIVQEINPNLNYLSLYGTDGKKDSMYLRTFNFPPSVSITKNGAAIEAKDIEAGDTVYIKFDENYDIELINVGSNYITVLGEVLSLGKDYMVVKYEDDRTQKLEFDDDITVFKDGDIIDTSGICVGDKVKLTLNQTDQFSKIKVVSIEGEEHYITNIYRGKLYDIDEDNLTLFDVKWLEKGKWIARDERGFFKIPKDEKIKMYYQNNPISLEDASQTYSGKYIYIAVYNDYGQAEKAIMVSCNAGMERTYNDEIVAHSLSSKNVSLAASVDSISYSPGTIVTKYGRLTLGSNIKANDPIYAVALRDPQTNAINASVIEVVDKPSVSGVDIYRGKISSIEDGANFTVESFAVLRGNDWDFVNTPKTFDLSTQTKIVDETGIVNNRDFIDYSTNNYKDKIVYIIVKDGVTELISNGQYGIVNLRGEIYNLSSSGVIILKDATVQNVDTGSWDDLGEATISTLTNSIIIKDNQLITPGQLSLRDKIRVIKKDNTNSGDGLIILVEE